MSSTKAKVAELFTFIQSADHEGVDRIYHADCCLSLAQPFGRIEQRRGTRELLALNDAYHRAFPAFRIHVDNLVAEGDRVAAQWHIEAMATKDVVEPMTQVRVRAEGGRVRVEGIAFYRLHEGRVLESFVLQDNLGMLMQLGVDLGGLPVVDVTPNGTPRPLRATSGAGSDLKRFMREFISVVVNEKDDARRDEAAPRYMHSDLRLHGPDAGNVDPSYSSIEKFTAGHRKYRRAFPEFEFVTLELIEEGNRVAFRWAVANAWHTGTLKFGEHELHPTGNNANVHGAAVCEIRDGKIASIWQLTDSTSLLRQLMS